MRKDIFIPVDIEEMTPLVDFKINGEMKIEGRSYPEDPVKFYEPLIDWVKDFKKECPPNIHLTLRLEYFNTSTSKLVLYIFKTLEELYIRKKSDVKITWLYLKHDEDMYESGKDYQSIIELPFTFVEYE